MLKTITGLKPLRSENVIIDMACRNIKPTEAWGPITQHTSVLIMSAM